MLDRSGEDDSCKGRNASMSYDAKCTVAMRRADGIVIVYRLNGGGVHNQQSADDPEDKASGIPRAKWHLPLEHDFSKN